MAPAEIANVDRHQRHAAALVLATSVLWLHEWLPALLVGSRGSCSTGDSGAPMGGPGAVSRKNRRTWT